MYCTSVAVNYNCNECQSRERRGGAYFFVGALCIAWDHIFGRRVEYLENKLVRRCLRNKKCMEYKTRMHIYILEFNTCMEYKDDASFPIMRMHFKVLQAYYSSPNANAVMRSKGPH
jgi:hypothetical protein